MTTNILVVEDQRAVAGALRMRLRGLGYGVLDIAKDGSEAIEKAARLHPDLILMDVKLGEGIDGIEAAARIRAEQDIPVIYVTAYADQELLERARHTNPAGFINKPITTKDLLTTLNLALNREPDQPRPVRMLREAVLTADREGRITYLNAGAERLMGWNRRAIVGRPLAEVMHMFYDLETDVAADLITRILKSGESHVFSVDTAEDDVLEPLDDDSGTRFGVALHFGVATAERSLIGNRRTLGALSSIVDYLPHGVIMVDRELHIVYRNMRARGILEQATMLGDDHGTLHASNPDDQAALERTVRDMPLGDAPDAETGYVDAPGSLFTLNDEQGGRLTAVVTAAGEARDTSSGESLVAVLLFDTRRPISLSQSILRAAYGLTRSEARLVQTLSGGGSLDDGATTLGIAVNTARTHLKHIFHKTGAKRQSELIHMAETGPASIPVEVGKPD